MPGRPGRTPGPWRTGPAGRTSPRSAGAARSCRSDRTYRKAGAPGPPLRCLYVQPDREVGAGRPRAVPAPSRPSATGPTAPARPASCAAAVIAGRSAIAARPVRHMRQRRPRATRSSSAATDVAASTPRVHVGRMIRSSARAPRPARPARTGRWGSCRRRCTITVAPGPGVAAPPRQLVEVHAGRVGDHHLARAGRRARRRPSTSPASPGQPDPARPSPGPARRPTRRRPPRAAAGRVDRGQPAERVAVQVDQLRVARCTNAVAGSRPAGRPRPARARTRAQVSSIRQIIPRPDPDTVRACRNCTS